jgi:hypothetical protein
MSIFGKLDAAAIPTNPFFVKAGEYYGTVIEAKYKTTAEGQKQLYIQYEITDEDSEYFGSKPSHFFNLVDENMTSEMFELLPAEEKKKIRLAMASVKKTLCGNDGNDKHKGLGVDINDLNDENWNPNVLVGTKVLFAIKNGGSQNEYVNIQWVNLAE